MSDEQVVTPEEEKVTYTEEEVKKLIESESDKKLSKVLAKKEEEFNSKINALVEEKIQEDKRLSKLSDVERKEAEFKKREEAIQQKELELKRSEVRADLINELSIRKLDTRFSDFITHDDTDLALQQLNDLNSLLDSYKETIVAEHFKSNGREVGNPNTVGGASAGRLKSTAEIAAEKRLIK